MLRRLALASVVLFMGTQGPAAQSPAVTIAADTVLDGRGGTLRNVTLRVEGARIAAVDNGRSGATYDLRGLTVMPGWIDTHVHIGAHFGPSGRASNEGETPTQEALYGADNAYATLMAGFTTVQSVGSMSDRELREAIARGVLPGPRLLTSLGSVSERTFTQCRNRKWS